MRSADDIQKFFGRPVVGLDLEWNPQTGKVSILGLGAAPDVALSTAWDHNGARSRFRMLVDKGTVFTGHNVIDADYYALRDEGIVVEPEKLQDTIIWHWLCNSHLCKTSVKSGDENENERRGAGYMGLHAMASVYTPFPFWKDCRGATCPAAAGDARQPCPIHAEWVYNGIDSLAPAVALPALQRHAKLLGVDHLYPFHAKLMHTLHRIRERGVPVDMAYVDTIQGDFRANKDELRDELTTRGFNPNSPKQIKDYFKKLKVSLDVTDEDAIRSMVEDDETPEAARQDAESLLEYKELGKGADAWFARYDRATDIGYVHADGFAHPRMNPYTSTARLACSCPNYHNIPKRRIDRKLMAKLIADGMAEGKARKAANIAIKLRRCVAAPEGYVLVRADYKSGENLAYLWMAGYRDLSQFQPTMTKAEDLHTWLKDAAGIKETDEFALRLGGAREASKSLVHAGDYLEGLSLRTRDELKYGHAKREVDAGARIVFWDWTFGDYIVTFTGANLAERAFGSRSWANRKKALEAQGNIFHRFPRIRDLQKRITAQCWEGLVQPPHKYALLSFGETRLAYEERLKTAAACWGSQPIAHFSKIALMRAEGTYLDPRLQVHDELLFLVDRVEWEKRGGAKVAADVREAMDTRNSGPEELKDCFIPVDVSWGNPAKSPNGTSNWADQEEVV